MARSYGLSEVKASVYLHPQINLEKEACMSFHQRAIAHVRLHRTLLYPGDYLSLNLPKFVVMTKRQA